MNDVPDSLDLRSTDIAEEKRQELLRLFPEVATEGGKLDFERLKLALGEAVDVGRERYAMNWPGKAECFRSIQAPSLGTLRPREEESLAFDSTGNLIIEGDNLEVLKLLQKSYLGRVQVIYIDPPYNSGNDLIYPDNYAESLQTYLQYTGQVDAEGRKFGTNADTDGRFHSKWLNMMYPRLYLARNLLRDDGVIFISIDDKELHNLRRICDELFGEENRVGLITWKNVTDNNPTLVTSDNEFILCYARSRDALPKSWSSRYSVAKDTLQGEFERLKEEGLPVAAIQERIREFIADNEESLGFLSRYKHVDEHGVYTGSESVHNPRPGGYDFEVLHPQTGKPMRKPANGYRFPESTFRDMEAQGVILYGPDEGRIVKIKKYLADYEDSLRSVISLDGRLGSYELKRLFPDCPAVFTNPKPTELLGSLISFAGAPDALVLDFFAGSGSTGHAVLDLNRKDGGSRRFILVQLPEACAAGSAAYQAGMATIADITKERVRRAAKSVSEAEQHSAQQGLFSATQATPDNGFRVFTLSESNFRTWEPSAAGNEEELKKQLELHVAHIREGRKADDLLFELLLKSGFPLTAPIAVLEIAGATVHSVAEGALLLCLERELTLELVRAIAERQPERFVCLDQGFAGNDELRANAVQIFRNKGVTSFKTV